MGLVIQFGEHSFQPDSGQLWRGKDELHLTPRAAALLRALIENPGTPVSKDAALRASLERNRRQR